MPEQEIIESILKEMEPTFKAHKGGAEIAHFNGETLVLRLKGHCSDCAMAPLTFGLILEKMIQSKLPQIKTIKYAT